MKKDPCMKKRILIVANRLPVVITRKGKNLKVRESPGGLATGIRSLEKMVEPILIGWPGLWPSHKGERKSIENELTKSYKSYPVFLSPLELEKYYYGFSNRTIWPLFHYFSTYSTYEESEWKVYEKVNRKFLRKVEEIARPQDVFWVHDYHLMLLPKLIKERFPKSSIGFFLHIPFPSSEIFRLLPWRQEILEGLLGADLIGFHTYEYARHFLSSVLRLLGHEHEFGTILLGERMIKVENFPMGIDVQNIESLLQQPSTQREIKTLRERTAVPKRKIVLSIDRMDYTKGIPERLKGVEYFLQMNPRWHRQIIFMMLCVPSRTKVKHYSLLKEEVDKLVGRINGRFGMPGWIPIHYMYRSLPFKKLLPLYAAADIALISPLRDGMNLVAKEYVISRIDNKGVLILSETAGASAELGEAILINVNNKEEIAKALLQALQMEEREQTQRMELMRKRLYDYDVYRWTKSFIERIEEIRKIQISQEHRRLNKEWEQKLLSNLRKSKQRLLLLDYDGTLISFVEKPNRARPDKELMRLLASLAENTKNFLVIISGRDRKTLDKWLGNIPCGLVAEHGAWIKKNSQSEWEKQTDSSGEWKEQVRPILKTYEMRVPGTSVEEREYTIAWNYWRANPELGKLRSSELFDYLNGFLASTNLQVMHGNKVVEVRVGGVDKGEAAKKFLRWKKWEFVLALGDDWTDEDIFKVLPRSAYSVKVGYPPTLARFYIESTHAARILLRKLSNE
jgi:trehalose 6-phosphate synthase/phosphatase